MARSASILSLKLCVVVLMSSRIICGDYLAVTNCFSNFKERSFFPHDTIIITPTCTSKEEYELSLNYDWTYKIDDSSIILKDWLKLMPNKTMKLEIPPYGLPPKNYIITVETKRKSHVTNGPSSILKTPTLHCCLSLLPFPPVAVLNGGLERMVAAETNVVVTAEDSFDPNTRDISSAGLKFIWRCEQKIRPPTFCKEGVLSTASSFVIPASHIIPKDEFVVKLHISSKFLETSEVTQTITIKEKALFFEISCRKNCHPMVPFPSVTKDIKFGIICHEHCDQIVSSEYVWSLKSKSNPSLKFDFSNWPYNGTGRKFTIPANTIKWGLYKVSADVKSKSGWRGHTAVLLPANIQPLHVETCEVEPNEGLAYHTLFKFSCSDLAKSLYYEFVIQVIYDLSKETVVISGFAPEVMNNVFRLPTNERRRYLIRIMEKGKPKIEIEMYPRVHLNYENPSIRTLSMAVLDVFNKKPDSERILESTINNLLAEDVEATSVLFEAIYYELVIFSAAFDEPLKEFLLILQETALNNILNDPIEEIKTTLAIKNSIENSNKNNISARSDPLLVEYAMNLCYRMSQNSLERLAEQVFPFEYHDEALLIANYLTKCLESYTNPHYETVIKPGETGNSTVPVDYVEDYVDHDEEYYEKLEKLVLSTKNLLRIGRVAAKLLGFTTPVGEGLIKVFGDTGHVALLKDTGSELSKTTIHFKDFTMRSSPDLANDTHSYDLMLTLWEKDITWWIPSGTKICTSIVSIEYWHSTCADRVISFIQRADVFLRISPERQPKQKINSYSIDIPSGFSKMEKDKLNYEIQVHKIDFLAKRKLYVYFHDISPGTVFDVVLVVNKFPTIKDFRRGNTTIRHGTNTSLFEPNDVNYGKFAYIGVLADRKSTEGKTKLKYKMSSIFTSCVKLFFINTSWTPTCRPGLKGNSSVIYCRCRKFSMIAGIVENAPSPIQELIQPDFELSLQRNRTVFVTTIVIFTIYFLLMLLVLNEKQDEFFFLADNEADDRFVYLLNIKTGTTWHAGTTANIVIKINGFKAQSKPHVLNYPDPKSRLLQQFGSTFFVLTTEHHLGLIKTIELWFDAIGEDPSWECREIIVYDLQLKKRWFFPVKQTLSLLLGTTYLVAHPSSKTITSTSFDAVHAHPVKSFKEKIYSACKFTLRPRYHTWYLWQKEENYTFLKKLTVILSNILSCFAITIMMLGTPKFNLTDNFDRGHDWKFDFADLLVAFLSSFITFMVHISIAWGFRFSRPQLSFYKQTHKMPLGYTIFFWFLIVFFIVASGTFLIACGFWLPYNRNFVWLTSVTTGITFGIIVYEGLFLLIPNIFCKFKIILDISYKFNYIRNIIEIQRRYLYGKFGEALLRPYFGHLYSPMEPTQIKRRFKVLKHRLRVASEVSELFFFGIYTILLYILILLNRDTMLIYTKNGIKEVLEGQHTRTQDFQNIEHAHEITEYINETFLHIIHPQKWYENYPANGSGLIIDMVKKVIGVVRIRQHRVSKDVCKIPEVMDFLNASCSPEFSIKDAEKRTFGPEWSPFTSEVYKTQRMWMSWQYSQKNITNTWNYRGKFATYPGGGYVAFLGRSLRNSQANLRYLATHKWFDYRSRAVFIEFLTYSLNNNVVNSVRLLFEHSASGFDAKSVEVLSARTVYGENRREFQAYVFMIVFATYSGILLLKYLIIFALHIRRHCKNFWIYFDIGILILSLLFVATFVIRAHLVAKYIQIMISTKDDEFEPYFNFFFIEDVVSYIGAILLVFSTVRIWKFLRFANFFLIFEKTLINVSNAAIGLIIASLIIANACVCAVLLINGDEFSDYHTVLRLLRLMITMRLEASEVPFEKFLSFRDSAIFWVVSILLSLISFDVMAALVCRSYTEAQIELSSQEKQMYTIHSYLRERCSYLSLYFRYKCSRMKGGGTPSLKIIPKADKLLYQRSIFIATHHLDIMIKILQCLIRNARGYNHFTNVDMRLMASIGRNYFLQKRSEVEVFFRGRVQGQRLQIVDEKTVDQIANVSNLILQEHQPSLSVKEEDNPKLQECYRIIHKKADTLHNCDLNLKLMLCTLNNVEEEMLEYERREQGITFLE